MLFVFRILKPIFASFNKLMKCIKKLKGSGENDRYDRYVVFGVEKWIVW